MLLSKCAVCDSKRSKFMKELEVRRLLNSLGVNTPFRKVITRTVNKSYVEGKGYKDFFNNWIDKNNIVQLSEYSPKPKSLAANVKAELDLSSYQTKTDIKHVTGDDISDFAKKTDSANLKSDFDKFRY